MRKAKFKKPSTKAASMQAATTIATGGTPSPMGTRAPEQLNGLELVVNNIIMRTVDRTPKDVGRLRIAHQRAESIYYPQRAPLYDLYKDVILDGHLSGIMGKRIKSVTNKKLRFVHNEKEDEELTKLASGPQFRRLLKHILQAIFWGVSGAEFIPGAEFAWKEIPRKHLKPERGVIAVNENDYEGLPYDEYDNFLVVCAEEEDVRDLGLLLKAAFYVLLKTGDFSDWANYIEIFGHPLIVTRFDTFDEKTKAQLAKAMDEMGSAMRLSIPKQAEIEVMDGKTANATGDLQDRFVKACDNQLSILVLGNTETTGNANGGSLAKSKEQGKQQDEIIKDDSLYLLGILNSQRFRNILAAYGYNALDGEWLIDETPDQQELLTRSQVDEALDRLGVPLGDDYFYKTYNRPKPDNYEELKAERQAASQAAQEATQAAKPAAPGKEAQPAAAARKTAENARLGAWDRLMAQLADFFAHGHKG